MKTETPRQTINRLNSEQRAIWDGSTPFTERTQRAIRLHEIEVELQNAWNAERVARAAISNPQMPDVPLVASRRHR